MCSGTPGKEHSLTVEQYTFVCRARVRARSLRRPLVPPASTLPPATAPRLVTRGGLEGVQEFIYLVWKGRGAHPKAATVARLSADPSAFALLLEHAISLEVLANTWEEMLETGCGKSRAEAPPPPCYCSGTMCSPHTGAL